MEASNKGIYKQIALVIVLAIIVAAIQPYALEGVNGLLAVHDWLTSQLALVFSGGRIGSFVQVCLSFIVLPFAIAGIIAAIYMLIKRKFPDWFMLVVWVVWLIMATALVMR